MKNVKESMDVIRKAIHIDEDYAWSWHCNLAMTSYDEGLSHKSANKAAARFMQICFDYDVTELKFYKDIMEVNNESKN